ncbi:glycosyltransferase family 39 protein [Thermicanus aegyptius]|uniref:glycosyltransferase family 39 protein n=1 Tax=Thermicanus aegyptius TaxID=94009 RepID=UPI0003F4F34C|nr:glycosyltransferase family 39 protein [Thermicanus aegyptius]
MFLQRIHRIGYRFLLILTLLFFSYLLRPTWLSIQSLFGTWYTLAGALFFFLLFLFGILAMSRWRLGNRHFLLLLFLVAFLLRFAWILAVPTEPFSDFKLMYESAVKASQGDYSFSRSPYYSQWVYQLGFTMYQALIVKIFGAGLLPLKILNALYQTGIALLLYGIGRHLFGEFAGRVAGWVYALYPSSIMMSSVLTNQHIADFLFYAGFALLMIKGLESRYAWIGIGLLLALGDIMRPYGPVVLLAVGFYFLLHYVLQAKGNRWIYTGRLAGLLLLFYLLHIGISSWLIALGVTSYPLGNRDPYWKFVEGFNVKSIGQYYPPDDQKLRDLPLEEKIKVEKEMIKERLSDSKAILQLLRKKMEFLWGSPDQAAWWSLRDLSLPWVERWETRLERFFFFAALLFGLASLIRLWRGEGDQKEAFFLLLILGYAAVHLLIEIQVRYRYFLIPGFLLFLGSGMGGVLYWCRLFFTRGKVKSL